MRYSFKKRQLEQFYSLLSFKLFKWQKEAIWHFYKTDMKEFHIVAPRQNGKSQVLLVIALIELFLNDNKITFTSHRVKSCADFFNKMKQEVNHNRFLFKRIHKIHNAVGSFRIELKSGAKIEFYSRSKDSGIGDSNDVIIFDEFQILNEKQMSAIFPTLAAKKDSVTIYAGTSPRIIDDDNFYRIQRKNHYGLNTWLEYGLGSKYDLSQLIKDDLFLDKKLLNETNPSMNKMIPYQNIVREFSKMDILDYAIQRLGLLHDEAQKIIFTDNMLDKVLLNSDEASKFKGDYILGIKFGKDYHAAVIGTQKNGVTYLQVLDKRLNKDGYEWLSSYINDNGEQALVGIMVDGFFKEAFETMQNRFTSKGNFKTLRGNEFISSQNIFEQEIMAAKLKIANQESIKEELGNVTWKEIKEYAKFAPVTDDVDVVVAEAMAIANYYVKKRGWN